MAGFAVAPPSQQSKEVDQLVYVQPRLIQDRTQSANAQIGMIGNANGSPR
jgi:hypothetical protein